MLIGMFVKMDGVETLQKDMQEEFIINSELSWKLFKRTYNKQGDFFFFNSVFPSVAGITALHCGRLLVVANAALNLQPNTLFLKKKKLKSNLRKNLDNNFMKNLDNFLSKKFTTKLFKIIIYGRESWCNSRSSTRYVWSSSRTDSS